MKLIRLALPVLIALAYAQVHAASPDSAVTRASSLGSDLGGLSVFAFTKTTIEANSTVFGSVFSGDVLTIGAGGTVFGDLTSVGAANVGGVGALGHAKVKGSVLSGDVLTVGDSGHIGGSITSSGASTVGAHSKVDGNMRSGGVATVGANASVAGAVTAPAMPVISATAQVGSARVATASEAIDPTALTDSIVQRKVDGGQQIATAQSDLAQMTTTTFLDATTTTDTTFLAGVYGAASWSTTAGITITLDAQHQDNASWVFNFRDIFVTGDGTKFKIINAGANDSVIWNAYGAGGYASLGANTNLLGTLLATTYISVGAHASVLGTQGRCGGVYSATSYVDGGDTSVIGGEGCTFAVSDNPSSPDITTAVPEPQTYALMLAGMCAVGFVARRRRSL